MLKKTTARPFSSTITSKTLSKDTIPLLTAGSTLPKSTMSASQNFAPRESQRTDALIPITKGVRDANFLTAGFSPDSIRFLSVQPEITSTMDDLIHLNVQDQKWVDNELEHLDKLYNQYIVDALKESKGNLFDMYKIRFYSEQKLKDLNKVKKILKERGLSTQKIDEYIKATNTTISYNQHMQLKLLDEPYQLITSPELTEDFISIIEKSGSANDVLFNINNFLRSRRYQSLKIEYEAEKELAKAQSKNSKYDLDRLYHQSNYEPHAELYDEFKKAGKQTAFFTGLTTEEYLRHKWATQQSQQKRETKAHEEKKLQDELNRPGSTERPR